MSALEHPHDPADASADVPRRRFGRRKEDAAGHGAEALAALHAEVLLLREENARLKAARHQPVDLEGVVGRARALVDDQLDRGNEADDAEQLLVDSMVIRESLLEICQEIERSMVAFEARLAALQPGHDQGRA